MKKYKTLLFDADRTLFDYDKSERQALRATFEMYELEFSEKALRQYHRVNDELWKQIERGETTLATLQISRFTQLFEHMGIKWVKCDPSEFNSLYSRQLEKSAHLIDGAEEVCARLCGGSFLYIITNGITSVQRGRLSKSALLPYMSDIFISEEVGFHKPHRYFFEAVLASLGNTAREDILVIGDTLSSDIAGGYGAGLDTCWYNPKREPLKGSVRPTYEISSLRELLVMAD